MASGPFQVLIDGPSIATLGATSGTATATFTVPHGVQVGASITIEGATGAGTALNSTIGGTNLYTVATVTGGTAFTFLAGSITAATANYVQSATVTNVVASGGTVTYTATNTFAAGQPVRIIGVNPSTFNITTTILSATGASFKILSPKAKGTYVSGGTATLVSPVVFSQDLLNPASFYSNTARPAAVYAMPTDITLQSSGDGSSSNLSLTVYQDQTPAGTASAGTGPWYAALPDNARIRFIDSTATTPATPLFLGMVTGLDVKLLPSGLGTETTISVADANAVLDRLIVRKAATSSTVKGQVANALKYAASDKREYQIVRDILANVDAQKSPDYSVQRLLKTSDTSGIPTSLTSFVLSANAPLTVTLGTLRSALDTLIEVFSGQDGLLRRYWVDATGVLHYERIDTPPASATAPFKIITTPNDAPDGSAVSPSTINPRELVVNYSLDAITKRAYFLTADANTDKDNDADPFVRAYNQGGVGLTTRQGPGLEAVVDAGTVRGNDRQTLLNTFATAYFVERSKPVLSGTFRIRGAGTQTYNRYGYVSGYAATGSLATWAPGQWVSVSAAGYGLQGELYRIESVSIGFESGSLQRVIDITFARKRQGGLARLVAGLK